MKILFKHENMEKIEKAIEDNQKRARVRKMNAALLNDALWNLELRLGIKKKDMIGTRRIISIARRRNLHI